MKTPELKQFGTLNAEDFLRHPVWISCHTADHGKPWFEDIDEETFRPYGGKLPVDGSEGMLLLRAAIVLKDGSRYAGFVTPGSGLGTQQPHMFVGDRQFGFWGGVAGITERALQDMYAALEKGPGAIFPLHFVADAGLATGIVQGQVDGFYRRSRDGVESSFAAQGRAQTHGGSARAGWLLTSATRIRGYPQPERDFEYLKTVYGERCFRCGIFERQIGPFRFRGSVDAPSGFTQLHWVLDAFFAAPSIFEEITKAGITGLSRGPAVYDGTGQECADRVQLLIPTVIACVETSRLPTVTCRPDNEEVVELRAIIAEHKSRLRGQGLSPELREGIRKQRELLRAIPYCGRVKYHAPTSVALMPDRLTGAPDLFQTAEWFGSGRSAFRLTLASERFVDLVRERRWPGLAFSIAGDGGWSERS